MYILFLEPIFSCNWRLLLFLRVSITGTVLFNYLYICQLQQQQKPKKPPWFSEALFDVTEELKCWLARWQGQTSLFITCHPTHRNLISPKLHCEQTLQIKHILCVFFNIIHFAEQLAGEYYTSTAAVNQAILNVLDGKDLVKAN